MQRGLVNFKTLNGDNVRPSFFVRIKTFFKTIIKKILAILGAALALSGIDSKKDYPYKYSKLPEINNPYISTAKTYHSSIAMAGKFNKRNNQLFKLRYKAATSYIPKNKHAKTGRAI